GVGPDQPRPVAFGQAHGRSIRHRRHCMGSQIGPSFCARAGQEPTSRLRNSETAMPDQSYAATEHALLEEITGPLQRLAEDPLELAPADFPTSMRGYDREAVDEYVRYTTRLVAELHAVRSPESAVRRAPGR